jgi:predicted  nucleic acid-binding Zn-ribbon protein
LNQEKKTIALRTELDKNKDIPRILDVNSEKHRMELIDMQARLEGMSKDLEDRAIELSGTHNELRQWKTDGLRLIAL